MTETVREQLTINLSKLTPEVSLSQRTAAAYEILAMCAGFTAANSGLAFTDAYFYLAEAFDMSALEGCSPADTGYLCANALIPFIKHIAKSKRIPSLRTSIPIISDLISQSVTRFIQTDLDLHPVYLGTGVWRLFTHVEAFQADEAVEFLSLIVTDIQATLDPSENISAFQELPQTILKAAYASAGLIDDTEPDLSGNDDVSILERLQERRTRRLTQPGDHTVELAWIENRIAAAERTIEFLSNQRWGNRWLH